MPENTNIHIGIPDPNEPVQKRVKPAPFKAKKSNVTLEAINSWLDLKYDLEIAKALKKIAASYPHGALQNFKKEINRHVDRVKKNS